MDHEAPVQYRARWIAAPTSGAMAADQVWNVFEGGIFTVAAGRIIAIERDAANPHVDLGDVLVLPGFVNAHVHLDLSVIREPLPVGDGFCDWLSRVVAHRRQTGSEAARSQAIERGVSEVIAGGAGLIGDYCAGPHFGIAQRRGLDGIIFQEVIGLKPQRYEETWSAAIALLDADTAPAVRVAPHAPYSTSRTIYDRCADMDAESIHSTHWYETLEERIFLNCARGPIREFLESIQAWSPDWIPPTWPMDEYLGTGRWLLAHGNYLGIKDLEWLARARDRFAIAYCPRTHDHFRHPAHPWRDALRLGIPVALGTDSRASSPDLSIFSEARWLSRRHTDIDPCTILAMLTTNGAIALGRPIGLLGPAGPATVTVLRLARPSRKPLEALFDDQTEVVGVMARGRWLMNPVR